MGHAPALKMGLLQYKKGLTFRLFTPTVHFSFLVVFSLLGKEWPFCYFSFTYSNHQACHLDAIKEFIGDVLVDKGAIPIHLKMNFAPGHGIVLLDFFS